MSSSTTDFPSTNFPDLPPEYRTSPSTDGVPDDEATPSRSYPENANKVHRASVRLLSLHRLWGIFDYPLVSYGRQCGPDQSHEATKRNWADDIFDASTRSRSPSSEPPNTLYGFNIAIQGPNNHPSPKEANESTSQTKQGLELDRLAGSPA